MDSKVDEQEVLVTYIKAELARLFEGGDATFFSQFNNLLGNFLCAPGHIQETRKLAKALIGDSYRRTGFEEIFCQCHKDNWYLEELPLSEFILPDMEGCAYFKTRK